MAASKLQLPASSLCKPLGNDWKVERAKRNTVAVHKLSDTQQMCLEGARGGMDVSVLYGASTIV
eukprot:5351906-Amphidinium_carterae.1